MRDTREATPDQQPQEWVIYVVAVIAEMVTAAGFIPQYTSILRSSVLYCLYREWGLAVGCGLLLPRFVGALLGVCFLKQKWLALKRSAQVQLKAMAAAAKDRAAGGGDPNAEQAGGVGEKSQRTSRRAQGEVSGYDVSAVSGEEVVELSSWTAENTSSGGGGGGVSGVRRRGAVR